MVIRPAFSHKSRNKREDSGGATIYDPNLSPCGTVLEYSFGDVEYSLLHMENA